MTRLSPRRRGTGLAAVVVAALLGAGCGTGDGAGPHRDAARPGEDSMPRGEGVYRPTEELQAPEEPPTAEIVDGSRRSAPAVVALDWRAVNDGEVRTPASRIAWPTISAQDWALRIAVDTAPFRVVMYRYPTVGATGIPREAAGTEQVCTGEATRCRVAADGRAAVDVRPGGTARDGYFVVQATWLVSSAVSAEGPAPAEQPEQGETSISWAFRITAPTVVP